MSEVFPFKKNIRLRPKIPRVIHAPRSYEIMLRDAVMLRIKLMPWFVRGAFHYHTNKRHQIQPQNIPFCGVYFIEKVGVADGDANVGEPRFRTNVRLGISVIIQNNDDEEAEYQLDTAYQYLSRGLLEDPGLYNNAEFRIQGYLRESRTHAFGSLGQDNEIPIAELRWDVTCDLGVITHPPLVIDPLEIIHVTTNTDPLKDPVVVDYDIEQNE